MSEIKSHSNIKIGTEKSFGIVFSLVFLIISLYPLINANEIRLWSFIVALILLFLTYFKPIILSIPNKIWFKFGILLASIISPIVMTIIYTVSIMPVALIFRLIGKDVLRLKLEKNTKSYWIKRDKPIGTMRKQF